MAQSALRDAVATRGGRIADDAPVRLRVRIDASQEGHVDVAIAGQGPRGALAERTFVASSCAEATDALGLVIALAGDEAERSDRDARIEPAVDVSPAATSSAPPVTAAPVTAAPVAATPTTAAPITADTISSAPPAPKREPGPPTSFALRAGPLGTTLGERQLGARIGAALEWRRPLLPWIEASFATTFPRTIEGGGGGADARWTTARVAVAPFGLAIGRTANLSAFGAFDAGALAVSGSGAARVRDRTRPWFAIAAGARARWELGSRLFAGLDAAAVVPLVKDEFVFLNGGAAYRVPSIAAETAIFIGVHFP